VTGGYTVLVADPIGAAVADRLDPFGVAFVDSSRPSAAGSRATSGSAPGRR
jgi:hypothetical protein